MFLCLKEVVTRYILLPYYVVNYILQTVCCLKLSLTATAYLGQVQVGQS
jgi:hypothetical protein